VRASHIVKLKILTYFCLPFRIITYLLWLLKMFLRNLYPIARNTDMFSSRVRFTTDLVQFMITDNMCRAQKQYKEILVGQHGIDGMIMLSVLTLPYLCIRLSGKHLVMLMPSTILLLTIKIPKKDIVQMSWSRNIWQRSRKRSQKSWEGPGTIRWGNLMRRSSGNQYKGTANQSKMDEIHSRFKKALNDTDLAETAADNYW